MPVIRAGTAFAHVRGLIVTDVESGAWAVVNTGTRETGLIEAGEFACTLFDDRPQFSKWDHAVICSRVENGTIYIVEAEAEALPSAEAAGRLQRIHPAAAVVELTGAGKDTLCRAAKASDDAERQFLAPLSAQAAEQLRESLQALVFHPDNQSS